MSATITLPVPVTSPTNSRHLPRRYAGTCTVADWNAFEKNKEGKYQLRNGEFIEMAGASYEHNLIAANMLALLVVSLNESDADCTALGSDQRVYIEDKNGLYPDVVVVCGEPMITPDETLQNPLLLVEVLSSSTAADDRGEKFEQYRTRPTLRHYLLVEQNRPTIEHFEKDDNGKWVLAAEHHALTETLTLNLSGAAIALPLSVIYRRVTFPEAASTQGESRDTVP